MTSPCEAWGCRSSQRAFVYCRKHNVSFDDMASRLATIDWHLLDCERAGTCRTTRRKYMTAVQKAVLPMWAHMIAVFENGTAFARRPRGRRSVARDGGSIVREECSKAA